MKKWRYILLACLLVSSCSSSLSTNPTATSNQAPIVKTGTATPTTIGPVPTTEVDQHLQVLWKQLDKGTPPANKRPIACSV